MPSRSRGRRGTPPPPPPTVWSEDDPDYLYVVEEEEEEDDEDEELGDDEGLSGEESGEGQEEEGSGSGEDDNDEEEEDGEQIPEAQCAPPAPARISASAGPSGGAAPERASMPSCPVCMEPWTSQGAHRISCIPCGHVYGRSCLERWLAQRGNQIATCPQCGKRFRHKNIINLFAPEVVTPNDELQKIVQEVSSFKEELDSVKKEVARQGEFFLEFAKRHKGTECGITDAGNSKRQKMAGHSDRAAHFEASTLGTVDFHLQNELSLDGARVFSIDASNQVILASGRGSGIGAEYVLTKVSMLSPHEARKILLPPNTKAVRDICILPGGSAIFTSLGKTLSLLSMTTDSIVLQCDLPAPGWSCSADVSGSHYIYAGLQNGMVLVFDIRQAATPLHSMEGLSRNPVHTLHSVLDNNGSRKVLSASAIGPCMWDTDGDQSRRCLLTGMENRRVCISLACTPSLSDPLVATFRPKVDSSSEDISLSQGYLSQTPARAGSGKLGHHTVITRAGGTTNFAEGRTCFANVSELRMSRSAVIPSGDDGHHLFAFGDESLCGVRTWQVPSFDVHADLGSHRQPILDVRYAESAAGGRFLGCLSEEKLQVFRIR